MREAIDYVIEKEERLNILDLGCGTGSLADFLHSYARRLDGVDISRDMLERATERGVYNNLVEEDLVQYIQQLVDRVGFRLCYQKEGIHEYRGIHAVVGVVYLLEKNSGC